MSELSDIARALVRDGHSVFRPSLDDRARIASALASRLGEGTLVVSSGAAVATARWIAWQKLSGLVVGVSMAGVGAHWALQRSGEAEPVARAASAPVFAEPPAAPVTQPSADSRAPARPVRSAPYDAEGPSKPVPPADRLAEEVSILSRATSELRASRPAQALRLLGEHQRRFPGGRLVEERRAAKIQALCALGNRASAELELERLARSSPSSPHLARAKLACGVGKPAR